MSCLICEDVFEVDGHLPDCVTGTCMIPPLSPGGIRIMTIMGLFERLNPVVNMETICRLEDVDGEDLRLMAIIMDLVKGGRGGQGR